MEFFKYHGAGNDFILMKDLNGASPKQVAKQLCHRRFGVGADGLMYPERSDIADIKMVYYNTDGSYATMCGNGLRCFSRFVYEEGLVSSNRFSVETGDGIKVVDLHIVLGQVEAVTVEMHRGAIDMVDHQFDLGDKVYKGRFLHLGVPHLVLPVSSISEEEICSSGPVIEKSPVFPQGSNVNFIQVLNRKKIKVDTWERGAGYTYACGTGCCASVYVACKMGLVDSTVEVEVKGGLLSIEVTEDEVVFMTGPAIKICKGNYLEAIKG